MNYASRRLSQAEIARLCGVSRSTVSLVLNGSPLVAEDTRRKVQAVLDELAYRPNRMARALAGKNSGLLGALLISCAQRAPSYHLGFLEGMLRAGTHSGVDLVVRGVTGESEHPEAVGDILSAFLDDNPIDGLALVSAPDLEVSDVQPIIDRSVPFVLLNKSIMGHGTPAITVDNWQAMFAAVEYLHTLGHDRLLYVHRPVTASRNFLERLEGFFAACQLHQVAHYEALDIDEVDNCRGDAFSIWWQRQEVICSAVLCTDTTLALAVQGTLTRLGLGVPDDVSLLSVGSSTADAQEAEAIQLTRLEIPVHQMGAEAVDWLVQMTSGVQPKASQMAIKPAFVERGSCGPPLSRK